MRFFKRNETAVSKFIFKDVVTGEVIDVDDAEYTIVYYDGALETEVVPLSSLIKLDGKTGEYICFWEIPEDAVENETYFVKATGVHLINETVLVLEDFYRIVSEMFFPGNGSGGMVIKFTKP